MISESARPWLYSALKNPHAKVTHSGLGHSSPSQMLTLPEQWTFIGNYGDADMIYNIDFIKGENKASSYKVGSARSSMLSSLGSSPYFCLSKGKVHCHEYHGMEEGTWNTQFWIGCCSAIQGIHWSF